MAMAGSLSPTADFFFWLCLKNSKIGHGGSAVALCDGLLRLSQSQSGFGLGEPRRREEVAQRLSCAQRGKPLHPNKM